MGLMAGGTFCPEFMGCEPIPTIPLPLLIPIEIDITPLALGVVVGGCCIKFAVLEFCNMAGNFTLLVDDINFFSVFLFVLLPITNGSLARS